MNFSLQIKQRNTDEWFTPPEAVRLIIPYLRRKKYKRILCPFDKEQSEFVQELRRGGFLVTYGHIETGEDFFERTDLEDFDAIVSNPPFSKRQAILERLFTAGTPFAMILNFNGLFDSKRRWDLFRRNRFEIIVPLGRIHFYNDQCEGNSPNFQSVFVCQGMADKQIEFTGGEDDHIITAPQDH